VGVGIQHILFPCQSTDQHQQRGLRKVEVSEECVYYPESIAGIDEQIGLSRSGLKFTRLPRSIFQSSNRRSANGYDSARLIACLLDLLGSVL